MPKVAMGIDAIDPGDFFEDAADRLAETFARFGEYATNHSTNSPFDDPKGASTGSFRVYRGGS